MTKFEQGICEDIFSCIWASDCIEKEVIECDALPKMKDKIQGLMKFEGSREEK